MEDKRPKTLSDEGSGIVLSLFFNMVLYRLVKEGVSSDEIYRSLRGAKQTYCGFFRDGKEDDVLNEMEIFREDIFRTPETFKEYMEGE